ncbi:SH3 domain-containing protein [Suilimivivens sp.]|uniref:SH3 domain-containing protein n=1 Tax=Suilimivivens sp. TaxID=2981669 RepID=UPI00307AEF57
MKKTDLQMRGQKIGIAFAMVLAVLLLLFPVTVHAEGELQVTELSTQGEITSDVNVRKGPSTDYDKIGTVRVGETIPVTGETADGWYRVTYQGQEGYIYGKYMTVQQTEPPADNNPQDGDGTAPGELPEKEGGFSALKLVAIVFIIIVIIIMIFLTIRSMRQTVDEDDEDEDEEDYEDEDYEDDDEDGEDAGEEDTEEETAPESSAQKQSKSEPYVLREEDYQLHIDPKYFEDEPVPQPECVTGYLKKKQEEEELEKKKEEEKASSGDLQKAMDKLQELQEELERLKKNSKE